MNATEMALEETSREGKSTYYLKMALKASDRAKDRCGTGPETDDVCSGTQKGRIRDRTHRQVAPA